MDIKNTAELRAMLLKTIEDVRSGVIDAKSAGAISNLSSKIIQSAKLDLDVMKANRHSATSPDQIESLQLIASEEKVAGE